MKILFVSDTHGNNEILDELYNTYPHMSLYLHGGDSCAYHHSQLGPFISVKGNCDHFMDIQESFEFTTPQGKAILKHMPYLSEDEKRKGYKFFLHGHTHYNEAESIDGIYHICPGSTTNSRKGPESFMIIEINDNVFSLTLYELENKNVLYTRKFL